MGAEDNSDIMPFPYLFPIQFEDYRDYKARSQVSYATPWAKSPITGEYNTAVNRAGMDTEYETTKVRTKLDTAYATARNRSGYDTEYETNKRRVKFPSTFQED